MAIQLKMVIGLWTIYFFIKSKDILGEHFKLWFSVHYKISLRNYHNITFTFITIIEGKAIGVQFASLVNYNKQEIDCFF